MAYYTRAKFHDRAAILSDYTFQVQWSEEEGENLIRNLERTTTTSGVGFVRQQGEDSPRLYKISGTIFHKAQYDAFKSYYNACKTRTVFFTDIDGVQREVLITAFNPQRKRTSGNPRDTSIRLNFWTYQMEIEVV